MQEREACAATMHDDSISCCTTVGRLPAELLPLRIAASESAATSGDGDATFGAALLLLGWRR